MLQNDSNTLTYTVRGEGSPGTHRDERAAKPAGREPSDSHRDDGIKPSIPEDDQDWFKEQYETKIGTPFSRSPADINVILKNLILKKNPPKESAAYAEPVNPKTEARLLKWPEIANIKKCLCRDFECICRGCKLSEAVNIPYATMKNNPPAGTFIGSLEIALIEATESYMLLLSDDRTMCLKCPEFCASRCISFKFETPDQVPSKTEHLEEKLRLDEYSYTLKKRRLKRLLNYQKEHAGEIDENVEYEGENDKVKDDRNNLKDPKSNSSRWKFGSKIVRKKKEKPDEL